MVLAGSSRAAHLAGPDDTTPGGTPEPLLARPDAVVSMSSGLRSDAWAPADGCPDHRFADPSTPLDSRRLRCGRMAGRRDEARVCRSFRLMASRKLSAHLTEGSRCRICCRPCCSRYFSALRRRGRQGAAILRFKHGPNVLHPGGGGAHSRFLSRWSALRGGRPLPHETLHPRFSSRGSSPHPSARVSHLLSAHPGWDRAHARRSTSRDCGELDYLRVSASGLLRPGPCPRQVRKPDDVHHSLLRRHEGVRAFVGSG